MYILIKTFTNSYIDVRHLKTLQGLFHEVEVRAISCTCPLFSVLVHAMMRKNIKMHPVVERASTIRREVGTKEICELLQYGFFIGRLRGWVPLSSGST